MDVYQIKTFKELDEDETVYYIVAINRDDMIVKLENSSIDEDTVISIVRVFKYKNIII